MFKLLTLSLAAAFTIYGLDEMKFISAADFDVEAAKVSALQKTNYNTAEATEAKQTVTTTAPQTVAITHQRFTDRIANKNKIRVQ